MNNKIKNIVAILIVFIIALLVGLAGGQYGAKLFGLPLMVILIVFAFMIQWLGFIFAYKNQTEKFFDITGSITFITVTILAIIFSPSVDLRGYLTSVMVFIWAIRLGSFLFIRIKKAGEDSRFNEIKPSFWRFLNVWNIQGLWVSLTLAAVLAIITSTKKVEFGLIGIFGSIIWLIGIIIEAIADQQKTNFRKDSSNKDHFIKTGLWSWSRHPNYFGEILIWLGIAIIALPILQGWQWLMLISPLFVILLITKVSGVPQLESKADLKWGGQEEYEKYKRNTSILIPIPPKKE